MLQDSTICTVRNGDGKYSLVKILVRNDHSVHVRLYKNTYDQRPTKIQPDMLTVGSVPAEGDDFGIGHIPLSNEGFDNWKPIAVKHEEVTKDDLDGYLVWLREFLTAQQVPGRRPPGLWAASFTPQTIRAAIRKVAFS